MENSFYFLAKTLRSAACRFSFRFQKIKQPRRLDQTQKRCVSEIQNPVKARNELNVGAVSQHQAVASNHVLLITKVPS